MKKQQFNKITYAIILSIIVSTAWADGQNVTLANPASNGPLASNPNPMSFAVDDSGKLYLTGIVSGLGVLQSNHVHGDLAAQLDISNAQVFIQKPDGRFQFYLQAGAYSIPDLGIPYIDASRTVDNFFGPLPQYFVKFVPNENMSIMVGSLPTLFGAEDTFSFQNMNIERGLVWNQENDLNRGIQVNFTQGPWSIAISWNDGYYSNRYTWVTSSAAYTIDTNNTISAYLGANLGDFGKNTLVTPVAQNNSELIGLIYTYNNGPWTINPYIQYTDVQQDPEIGLLDDASTFGAALLAKYAFPSCPNFNLAGRIEYINSNGDADAPNLLYGPGSKAWSFTLTPTFQKGIFFIRADAALVSASNITDGDAFGSDGNDSSQVRLFIETGVMF